MALQDEIDNGRQNIKTDGYPMSVGELLSIYKDDELDLHPEFQRLFRWSDMQKARLIESLLLGIPIPSIFVSQREDGVWDVIDGLQRLSTVFEFMGELRGPDGGVLPPLRLVGTKYLPSLKGVAWEDDNVDRSLTKEQQLLIKRSKFDLKIILRESDAQSKYDLFDRLNTGGSILSDQELRNSIIESASHDFLSWLTALSSYEPFRNSLVLSERQENERFGMELAVRFLVLRTISDEALAKIGDLGTFLTTEIMMKVDAFKRGQYDLDTEERAFKSTFEFIDKAFAGDAFRRYDANRQRSVGGFLVSAFEFVGLGLGFHTENLRTLNEDTVKERVKAFWTNGELQGKSGSGVRASTRIPLTVKAGRMEFSP